MFEIKEVTRREITPLTIDDVKKLIQTELQNKLPDLKNPPEITFNETTQEFEFGEIVTETSSAPKKKEGNDDFISSVKRKSVFVEDTTAEPVDEKTKSRVLSLDAASSLFTPTGG